MNWLIYNLPSNLIIFKLMKYAIIILIFYNQLDKLIIVSEIYVCFLKKLVNYCIFVIMHQIKNFHQIDIKLEASFFKLITINEFVMVIN